MSVSYLNYASAATLGNSTSATCAACAVGDSVAVGDTLVAFVFFPGSGNSISAMTDPKGNTWSSIGKISSPGGSEPLIASLGVRYCTVTTAMTSSDTVTVTLANAVANKGMMILHFRGLIAAPRDQDIGMFTSAPGGPPYAAVTDITATTVQADELVVAGYADYYATGTSPGYNSAGNFYGTGYTDVGTLQIGSGNQLHMFANYRVVSATGQQKSGAGVSALQSEYFSYIITLKAALVLSASPPSLQSASLVPRIGSQYVQPSSLTSASTFGRPSVTVVKTSIITFVAQRANGQITTAATSATASAASVTVGNYLIALVSIGSQAGGLSSVTDNRGNTWTVRQNVAGTTSAAGYAFADTKVAVATSPITITFNFSAAVKADWYVVEISGLHPSAWYDQVAASKTNAGPAVVITTNAITPAVSNECLLAVYSAGAWTSGTMGSGFTGLSAPFGVAPDHYGGYDLDAGTPASTSALANVNPSIAYSAGLIAYKPALGSLLVNPAYVASASSFGTLKGNLKTLPISGVSSQSSFGTPTIVRGAISASPASLASQSAFGTPGWAISGQVIPVSALASQSSFGTLTIKTVVTVAPTGLGSQSAFGTVTIKSNVTAIAAAIASASNFGVPLAKAGNVTKAVTALGSQSAFGISLSFSQRTPPITGPASQSAFGTPTKVTGGTTRTVTALASASVFGLATGVPGPRIAQPTALASQSAFGFPLPLAGNTVRTVTAIPSQSAIGSPGSSQRTPPITGPTSQSAFGAPVIKTNIIASPASITSQSAFGAVTTILTGGGTQYISPASVTTQSSFGTVLAKPGGVVRTMVGVPSQSSFSAPPAANQRLTVPSVASASVFGTITTRILAAPASLGSQSAFGTVTSLTGNATRSPASLASASQFGTVGTGGSSLVVVGSVTSQSAFGTLIPRPGNIMRSPASLTTAQLFGAPTTVTGGVSRSPAGLGSQSSFGIPQSVGGSSKVTPASLQSSGAFGTITAKAGNTVVNLTGLSVSSASVFGGIYQPSIVTVAAILDKWRHEKRERGVMI